MVFLAPVFWVIYVVCLAAGLYEAWGHGIVAAIWEQDTYYVTTLVAAVWLLGERAAARSYFGETKNGIEDRWDRIADTVWYCDMIVRLCITASLVGIAVAFWPFLKYADVDVMRQHIGEFFGNVAVAIVPAAVGFVAWTMLEINIKISRSLLQRDDK